MVTSRGPRPWEAWYSSSAAIIGYLVSHVRLVSPGGGIGLELDPFTDGGLLAVFALAGMGVVGFLDDWIKFSNKRSLGLSKSAKFGGQLAIAALFAWGATEAGVVTEISFVRPMGIDLGAFFVIWVLLMLTGWANGVNLADGMDGLAGGSSALVVASYTVIAFWQFRNPQVYESVDPLELAIISAAMFGAILGFLWWNAPPAKIIMGDVGSQGIGGLLAALALLTNTSLLLVVLGAIFVAETASVILQVASFKIFGKRIFRMSPIHYHFDLGGWPETTVVIRFWILTGFGVALGLGFFYGDFLRLRGLVVTRVLVLGAGVSGLAAAALARDRGMTVTIYTRDQPEIVLEKGFPVASGGWDPVLLTGIDLVVASPGFSERSLPIVESLEWGIPVWSEIEFAWRHLTKSRWRPSPGTNGKTTVTEAASAMLEASGIDAPAAGNIGSALSELRRPGTRGSWWSRCPASNSGSCEDVPPDQRPRSPMSPSTISTGTARSISYRSAKARIFMQPGPMRTFWSSMPTTRAPYRWSPRARPVNCSRSREVIFRLAAVESTTTDLVIGELTISIGDLVSDDPAHLVNIASASALALRMGATADGVTKAARSFAPGPHRRSLVATQRRCHLDRRLEGDQHPRRRSPRSGLTIRWSSSPGAWPRASTMAPIAREPNVRSLIGIGEAGPDLVAAAGERGHVAATLERAVESGGDPGRAR